MTATTKTNKIMTEIFHHRAVLRRVLGGAGAGLGAAGVTHGANMAPGTTVLAGNMPAPIRFPLTLPVISSALNLYTNICQVLEAQHESPAYLRNYRGDNITEYFGHAGPVMFILCLKILKDFFREINTVGYSCAGYSPTKINVIGTGIARGFFNKSLNCTLCSSYCPRLAGSGLSGGRPITADGLDNFNTTGSPVSPLGRPGERRPAHAIPVHVLEADRLHPDKGEERYYEYVQRSERTGAEFDRIRCRPRPFNVYLLRTHGDWFVDTDPEGYLETDATGGSVRVPAYVLGPVLLSLVRSGSALGVRTESSASDADFYTDKPP